MSGLGIHLLSVLLLAVLVEIACRLGRFRPAICHALWLIVLVKLVVPPVVAWTPGYIDMGRFEVEDPSNVAVGVVPEARESVARLQLSDGVPGAVAETEVVASTANAVLWKQGALLAMGLWLVGSVLLLGRILYQARQARRVVASGIEAPAWLREQLRAVCATLKIREPRAIQLNTGCGGVYVHFLGRPTLVISSNALDYIERDQWHTILTHEMAHLKRRDHWVAWLILAASVAWWWNPCLWWVRNRIHLHSELACDAWVVNTYPDDRKDYAETMVQVLTLLSERFEPAPAMGLAVWSSATQERRLWMVMKGKGASKVGWLYAAGLTGLSVVLSPAWIAVGVEEQVPATEETGDTGAVSGWTLDLAPQAEVTESLGTVVAVNFGDIYIKDAIEFLQDSYDVNIVVDQRVIAPDSRNPQAPFLVGAPGSFPSSPEASNGGKKARATKQSDLGNYATDGVIASLVERDSTLREVLDKLSASLDLRVETRGELLWLTNTAQQDADQLVPPPMAKFSEGEALDRLDKTVMMEFEDIHLMDVMGMMNNAFNVNVVVDHRVVAPEGTSLDSAPAGSPAYATDGMIRYINLKNCSMASGLYAMTRLLNLSYVVTEDGVFISTPALLQEEHG